MIALPLVAALALWGCGGGGGVVEQQQEETQAGVHVFNLDGGDSITTASGNGGSGGEISIDAYGDVKFLASGTVDVSCNQPPDQPSYIAGDVEMVVGADLVVNAVDLGDAVPQGGYFLRNGGIRLYHDTNANGIANTTTEGDQEVESLHVQSGATLTLGLNIDDNGLDGDGSDSTGQDMVSVSFSGDVLMEGTIQPALLNSAAGTPDSTHPGDSGSLELWAHNIFITSTGQVLARGGDSSTDRGGHGGAIYLGANRSPSGGGFLKNEGLVDASGGDTTALGYDGGNAGVVLFDSGGKLVNTGQVLANGGQGDKGGLGANIGINARSHLYNLADLSAVGGLGINGTGGSGGSVELYSNRGEVCNEGDLSAWGGTGTTGGGGGGSIYLLNDYGSHIRSSGVLNASGGDATTDGFGGSGGSVFVGDYSGPFEIVGAIYARGGMANGTSNYGGDGGDFEIEIDDDYDYYHEEELPVLDVKVAADIDLSGGDGDFGGDGGYIYVSQDAGDNVEPPVGDVVFYGVASVSLDGGSSIGGNGGSGGSFEIDTEDPYARGIDFPTGAITVEVAIYARGGAANAATGIGGSGGSLDWEAEGEAYVGTTVLESSGTVDISGGSGDIGGSGGSVFFYAHDGLENSGSITARGGDGTTTGGSGGTVELYATYDAVNTGTIDISAGGGTEGNGGAGDYAGLASGYQSTNSGSVYVKGGIGNSATGIGGNGGVIDLFSQFEPTSNTATILSVVGGLANTPGTNGYILIDWTDVTPEDGTLP